MKKLLAICLAMVVVLCFSATAFAAPTDFVKSPGSSPAPDVEDFKPNDDDCTARVVTPFGDLDKLPPDNKEEFQIAYDTIIKTDDITKLNDEIAKKAEELGIDPEEVGISDLFYVECQGCDDHENHTNGGKIVMDIDTPETFMGVIYLDDNGKWQWVDGAFINNDGKLEFIAKDLDAPYAIVVDNSNGVSPGTGEGLGIFFWIAIASTAALLLVLVLLLFKKKRA